MAAASCGANCGPPAGRSITTSSLIRRQLELKLRSARYPGPPRTRTGRSGKGCCRCQPAWKKIAALLDIANHGQIAPDVEREHYTDRAYLLAQRLQSSRLCSPRATANTPADERRLLPYGSIGTGGMFTVPKVRDALSGHADPGWYRHPPGTTVYRVSAAPHDHQS